MLSMLDQDIVDCYYIVKFCKLYNIFQIDAEFKNLLKNCDEFFIKSKMFKSHKQCVSTITQLLTNLTTTINESSSTKFILVSKINPQYSKQHNDVIIKDEVWDNYTVIRYYVAEFEPLKLEGILKFAILGEIKYDIKQIDTIKKLFTGTRQ